MPRQLVQRRLDEATGPCPGRFGTTGGEWPVGRSADAERCQRGTVAVRGLETGSGGQAETVGGRGVQQRAEGVTGVQYHGGQSAVAVLGDRAGRGGDQDDVDPFGGRGLAG